MCYLEEQCPLCEESYTTCRHTHTHTYMHMHVHTHTPLSVPTKSHSMLAISQLAYYLHIFNVMVFSPRGASLHSINNLWSNVTAHRPLSSALAFSSENQIPYKSAMLNKVIREDNKDAKEARWVLQGGFMPHNSLRATTTSPAHPTSILLLKLNGSGTHLNHSRRT